MSSEIVERRKQIFNAIRNNNTVIETETVSAENKEQELINNETHMDANLVLNNTEISEQGSAINDENTSDQIITLNDDNGSEISFELLDLITYRKKEYVVLLPIDGEADQVVILQVEVGGADKESYIGVDNEYTCEAVFSLFEERNQQEFDFID